MDISLLESTQLRSHSVMSRRETAGARGGVRNIAAE